MTKLRSGEVLYRDVGYVSLPLHIFVRNPETIDNRLTITHPVNKIDAHVDCTINVKLDTFQTKVPIDITRPLNKKLTHSLSSYGLVDAPKKKSLITINSQYFDIQHSRDENDQYIGGIELKGGKENSFDEGDDASHSKIVMLNDRSVSLMFKTDSADEHENTGALFPSLEIPAVVNLSLEQVSGGISQFERVSPTHEEECKYDSENEVREVEKVEISLQKVLFVVDEPDTPQTCMAMSPYSVESTPSATPHDAYNKTTLSVEMERGTEKTYVDSQ
jgi:hypothetical protein